MPRIPIIYRVADEAGNAIGGSSQQVRIWDDFACTVASVVTDDSGGGTTIEQPLTPNAGTYTTLAVTTAAVDTTITVVSTTGFAVGQLITIYDPTNTVYKFIRAILSGPPRLTLESAVGFIFSTTNTQVGNLDQVGVVGGWVLDTSYHYSQVTDVASGRKGPPQLISAVIGSANVGVLEEGAGGGTRPTINFIGSSVTAVDNPGASRVDVTVTGKEADGSEAAPSIGFVADSDTGLYRFGSGSFALVGDTRTIMRVTDSGAGSDDHWFFANGPSGVSAQAVGADTNVSMEFSSKGANPITLYSGSLARVLAQFVDAASAVNYLQFHPSATAILPFIQAAGSDTNVSIGLSSKGTGAVTMYSGATARVLGTFLDVPSSVNYLTIQPSATGSPVLLTPAGTDVNVDLQLIPKGTGVIRYKGGAQLWPLNSSQAQLGAVVTMTTAGNWYDGPSLSLGIGTWIVWATLTIQSGNVAAGRVTARISDGTTHYASTETEVPGAANDPVSLSLIARITLGSTTTIKAQASANQNSAAILEQTPTVSSGNNASILAAFQVLTS